ncbi:MAG: O-methyltransferase [Alphaproteobacteria bacterium]|nr:O-methyltransferase [Alphaproteobacteria bacterium]
MPKTNSPNLDYIRSLYAPQDALLQLIDETLAKRDIAMQVGPEEGKLLQLFIGLYGVKTIVEIGTLAGYSAIWMARALPEDGHLYTLNKDDTHIALARQFFANCEVRDRITMIEGDARTTLPTLSDKGPFDMAFIDADKIHYNDYLDWAEVNVRTGGLIIADNTLLFGMVAKDSAPDDIAPTTWENMRRFNERLADSSRYFSIMIPTQEGMTVAVKLF